MKARGFLLSSWECECVFRVDEMYNKNIVAFNSEKHIFKFTGEQSAAIHQISNGQQKIYHRINIAIILLFVLVF